MNILFLHPNFPAQFKMPCIELASQQKHKIKFICQTHYGRELTGIEKLVLKGGGSHQSILNSTTNEIEKQLARGRAYRFGFEQLKNNNWIPDVVVAHSGWGCGIYIKEIWPKAKFISYLEWWFDPQSELMHSLKDNKHFKLNDDGISYLWIRNMPAALEMASADHLITPTEWQKKQLPIALRDKCRVVRDAIDNKTFFPDTKKLARNPIVTYGTRGMEPMRGFPEFIEVLPHLLQKWPTVRVEIAGSDTVSYGGNRPKEKSWKKWASNILKAEGLSERVTWKGEMPLQEYANWLRSSWCHVYLSEPFVTSWSFIEALHCRIPMVASATGATLEFNNTNPNMIEIDHKNPDAFLEAISNRIRFSSKISRSRSEPSPQATIKNPSFFNSTETSLASIIADVEAATKI
jgi:glycosyltransferase involved in cell wall biosynthesis